MVARVLQILLVAQEPHMVCRKVGGMLESKNAHAQHPKEAHQKIDGR